jgi:hypothetical protein
VRWACVADLDNFVCHSVLAIRSACIHPVNMIDATADRVFFYDSDAHIVKRSQRKSETKFADKAAKEPSQTNKKTLPKVMRRSIGQEAEGIGCGNVESPAQKKRT